MVEPYSFAFYLSSVPFTKDVLTWRASLGGSESACLVTMRALAQRGHRVYAFAEQLEPSLDGWRDDEGVTWWPAAKLQDALVFMRFDVFVSLRMPQAFGLKLTTKLNIFWAQDMLTQPVTGSLAQCDLIAYVSDWHRRQWAAVDDVVPRVRSFITPNAVDHRLMGSGLSRYRAPDPTALRFIHVSRPERGLDALLALWPKIRATWPAATLSLCRYSSMYDAHGWGRVCASYDAKVAAVNAEVGGIEYLGELAKPALYAAIAGADLMLYPTSQAGFGETNCIACTESQMCGTPFLGTARGALPETLHPEAGRLLEMTDPDGWQDPAWQDRWVATMTEMLDPMIHRRMVKAGIDHARDADGPIVARIWEEALEHEFTHRFATQTPQILKRLLNDDNHVLARRLLQHPEGCAIPGRNETLAFCDRVIAGHDQTATDYAERAIQDGTIEGEQSPRIRQAAEYLAEWLPEGGAVLDYACGNGAFLYALSKLRSDATLWGVDYSDGVLAIARTTVPQATLVAAADVDVWERAYDGAFCGEFLEHCEAPWAVLSMLEERVIESGPIVCTMPAGPWTELMEPGIPIKRGHLWTYDERDLRALFGMKRDVRWEYFRVGDSPKGSPIGFWIVRYRCDPARVSPAFTPAYLDFALKTERPYPTIHVGMIMRNESEHIIRCLHSIRQVVDKIVIYDTGSTDDSVTLARAHGAEVIEGDWPEDFSEARNRVLAIASAGADVFFWLDADEWLTEPGRLRDAVTLQAPFNGWSMKQYHFQSDKPNFYDKPVRLFRTGRGIKFFGVVHEQPGTGLNEGILPALMLERPMLLHLGYTVADTRVSKMLHRNLELLKRECRGDGAHPPRDLAWVLAMRDCVNLTLIEGYDGDRLNERGVKWLAQAMKIYQMHFTDPAHPLHDLAYDHYQQALKASGAGIGIKWAFGAGPNIERAKLTSEVVRALTPDEGARIINARVTGWLKEYDRRQTIPVPPPAASDAIVRPPAPVEA